MTIQLRPLLGIYQPLRPELRRSVIEFWVQEAFREVARRSMLIRELVAFNTTANTNGYPLAVSSGNAPIQVHSAYIMGPNETTYAPLYEAVADPGAPIEAAVPTDSNTPGGYPNKYCQVGDTVYFDPCPDTNIYQIKLNVSTMPLRDPTLQSVNLPEIASKAIELLAAAYILKLPGPAQDPLEAQKAMASYESEMNTLRADANKGRLGERPIWVPKLIGIR
jgi:hypothetical protein